MAGQLASDRYEERPEPDGGGVPPALEVQRAPWASAALAAALVGAVLHAWWHAGFTMDDAAISFSYARSLVDGTGLGVIEPGGARVEGYSNFSWVLLLALALAAGIPVTAAAKVLGAASLAGAAWLLHSILARLVRRRALVWAAVLLPLTTCVAFWSISGLESGLYLLLVLGAARLLLREEADGRWWNVPSALALALAAVTRPEAFVFAAAALGVKVVGVVVTPGDRLRRSKQLAAWVALSGVLWAGYLAWHVAFFGFVFPNTVYAKGASPSLAEAARVVLSWDSEGWSYLASWFSERGGIALLPAILAGAVPVLRGPGRAVAAFAAAGLALPLVRPDWMVEHRFLVPFVPFAVALAAAGVDAALDLARGGRGEPRVRLAVAAVATAASAYYLAVNARASVALRSGGYAATVSVGEVRRAYERKFEVPVKELGLRDPLIALPDLGATTFELRMRTVDLGGLADAHLAHLGDHARLNLYLFDERRPDLVHAHGYWLAVLQLPFLPGIRDYVLFAARRGPEDGFDVVRRDLFLGRLQAGVATTPLAGDVVLADLEGPDAAEPGAILPFDLHLGSEKAGPAPIEISLEVARADGTVVAAQPVACGPSFYGCAGWAAGERVRQRVNVAAGDASGGLVVRVRARGAGERDWRVRFSRPLIVDAGAAVEYARSQRATARLRAAAGDVAGMERALELGEAAAPGLGDWGAERAACRTVAARGIAGRAESCLATADWPCALDVLRGGDRIGGARTASPELRDLAARLLAVAKGERDPTRAYLAYRASWFANPQDPSAQRGLIEARAALPLVR